MSPTDINEILLPAIERSIGEIEAEGSDPIEESDPEPIGTISISNDEQIRSVKDMSERLVDEPDKKRRWHDAFVDDPVELCKLLKHFNVTQDPDLEAARLALEDAMRGTDIDSIKDSPIVRANLKGKVDSILKTFDW